MEFRRVLFRSRYDSVSSRPRLYAFLGVGKEIIREDPSIECYAVDATILHLCKEFVDNANSLVIAFGAVPARVSNPEEEETLLALTKHTTAVARVLGLASVLTLDLSSTDTAQTVLRLSTLAEPGPAHPDYVDSLLQKWKEET